MAEEKQTGQREESSTSVYYIIGAIILVVVVAAGYLLRPKTSPTTSTAPAAPAVPTPTPGPITGFACERQYYNPVIGFPQYYLSVEGVDVTEAESVDCTFTVSVGGNVVATTSAKSPMTATPQRGGNTFRCTTKKLDLTPDVPTIVDVALKDDLKKTLSCTNTYLLPKP